MIWERGAWSAERGARNNRTRHRCRFFHAPSPALRARRSAFTLFEVALVLALLVVIAAMAWPQLSGVFASERLKQGADQLRADFIRARVSAMNTGRVHSFSWDPTTGRYFVVAIDEGSIDAFSMADDSGGANALPVIDRALPEGVTLHGIASMDDVTPPPAAAMAPEVAPAAMPVAAAISGGQMQSVYFHPDGTTSSALVTLTSEGDLFLDVRLRGLTGGTAVDEVVVAQGGR